MLYEKIGRINYNTGWFTIFTLGNAYAQAVAFIEVSTVYNTPSVYTSKTVVMARANKTYSIVQQL